MDYCTLWFEGWWAHCCQAHDLAYTEHVVRSVADEALRLCVATSADGWLGPVSAIVGAGMYIAVRVFGGYFYKR